MTWLLVALGGALGAVTRFVVDGEIKRHFSSWPLATLVINLVGSFVLGWAVAEHPSANVSALVVTGLCGGFTTFSTASVDTLTLARQHRPTAAFTYALGTLLLCVVAVWCGGRLAS